MRELETRRTDNTVDACAVAGRASARRLELANQKVEDISFTTIRGCHLKQTYISDSRLVSQSRIGLPTGDYWQADSQREGRGGVTAVLVEVKPLALQVIPIGSMQNLEKVMRLATWKERLQDTINNGKKLYGQVLE